MTRARIRCHPHMAGLVAITLLTCWPRPLAAQTVVFDPARLVQLIRTLVQAQAQYTETVAQRRLWAQLARALPDGRTVLYAVPPTAWSMTRGTDDLDPFGIYPPLRRAIESGDPTGLQWRHAVVPLATYPAGVLARLSPSQRLHISREYTHPLTSDGLGIMGIHALAYNRDGQRAAIGAINRVADRLAAGQDRSNIALHQQLVATDILAVRERHLHNVYLAYLVEDLVSDLKRYRDAETRRLNADQARRLASPTLTAQTTAETDRVLRNFWRAAR